MIRAPARERPSARSHRRRKARQLPPQVQRFAFLKSIAHFEGAWENCRHPACRARQQCTGGPRGTCATTGVPLCRASAPAAWWAELAPVLDRD